MTIRLSVSLRKSKQNCEKYGKGQCGLSYQPLEEKLITDIDYVGPPLASVKSHAPRKIISIDERGRKNLWTKHRHFSKLESQLQDCGGSPEAKIRTATRGNWQCWLQQHVRSLKTTKNRTQLEALERLVTFCSDNF
uniref:Uncharacterized protein n=1 Tax=Schistocephalus solidus TaxID=70667 RepID=A0A0V0J6Z9_SCHSO